MPTVTQDDKYAAAASPLVGATAEDIKAAAAMYLRIINESNVALDSFNRAVARSNAGMESPSCLRAAAEALSAANTKNAAQLWAYGPWHQSVRPLIDQIIAQY